MFGGWDVARHGAAPQCKRVNDRSFRTVVSTAQTMMRAGLGRMMGVILMSYGAVTMCCDRVRCDRVLWQTAEVDCAVVVRCGCAL